jgi:hypothetical protein
MIGLSAILVLSMFFLIPATMVVVALKQRNCLFAIITGFMMLIPCSMIFTKVKDMWCLYTLEASEVSQVSIDDLLITEEDKIGTIVEALNSPSWFMVNHGGWEIDAPVVITLKSGETINMFVSPYLREEGAVVHLDREAFSRTLPKALEETGVYLPNGKNWEPIEGAKGAMIDPKSIRQLEHGVRAWVKLPLTNYSPAFIVTVTQDGELSLQPGRRDGFMYETYEGWSGRPKKPDADDEFFNQLVDRLLDSGSPNGD